MTACELDIPNAKDIFGFVKFSDPQALRALAHPLRLELIELLGTLGTATAAECARRLGTSQASCSFHLRQLAKYDFVTESERGADGRERPWRLTDLEQSWSSETGMAAERLEHVFVGRETERMLDWVGRSQEEPADWRRAAFLGGMTLPLTAAELETVGSQLRAVLDPYATRLGNQADWPEGARLVRLFLSAVPLHPDSETTPT
jgi:DNA-binding transcriptional ArsR family regulator